MLHTAINISHTYWKLINQTIEGLELKPSDRVELKVRELPTTHPAWTKDREPIIELHINNKFTQAFNDVAA